MKRIALLRHAEAVDRAPEMRDIDRPLTAKGREDAALMGAFIAKSEGRPDLALCSPSARTRETLDGVNARLPEPLHVIFNDAVYDAMSSDLLEAVQALPDQFAHVLLIGHNPGFYDFALDLVRVAEKSAMKRLRKKFPKGALAEFVFDIDAWRDADFASGRLVAFTRPKDLRSCVAGRA